MPSDGDLSADKEERLVLLPGKIIRKSGALAFHSLLVQFFLTVPMGKAVWLAKLDDQDEVWVGVRTSCIKIESEPGADDVCLRGRIESVLPHGAALKLGVLVGAASIPLRTETKNTFNRGDDIRLYFNRNRAMLFQGPLDSIEPRVPLLPLAVT